MIRIKKVDYISGYKLVLTFTDKKVKIVDLKKYKNASPDTVFYPFRDLEFFRSVKVDKHTGTIVWPNGVDLCPDVLYEVGEDILKEKKQPIKSRSRHSRQRKKSAVAKFQSMPAAKRISKKSKYK